MMGPVAFATLRSPRELGSDVATEPHVWLMTSRLSTYWHWSQPSCGPRMGCAAPRKAAPIVDVERASASGDEKVLTCARLETFVPKAW